jgi:hypothetical protein
LVAAVGDVGEEPEVLACVAVDDKDEAVVEAAVEAAELDDVDEVLPQAVNARTAAPAITIVGNMCILMSGII